MKVVIDKTNVQNIKGLSHYLILTQEKLKRSDADFECALNRLFYIAHSKVALDSAHVMTNLLLYISMMFKASYQNLCILQANEKFMMACLENEVLSLEADALHVIYQDAFRHFELHSSVTAELSKRLFEFMLLHESKAKTIARYFKQHKLILLQLISQLKRLAIGYQEGDETSRRAFLFAKLLGCIDQVCMAYEVTTARQAYSEAVDISFTYNDVNINNILPNLMTTIGVFDFGICFTVGQAITLEMHQQEGMHMNGDTLKKDHARTQGHLPKRLMVFSKNVEVMNRSMRRLFQLGVVVLRQQEVSFVKNKNAQNKPQAELYLASSSTGRVISYFISRLKKCRIKKVRLSKKTT